jgi:intracellular sulfur oxidation DsrE/DsrF family protein
LRATNKPWHRPDLFTGRLSEAIENPTQESDMTARTWTLKTIAALALSASTLCASAQNAVVYHINDTASQALAGLRNVRNHLEVDPQAKITVVTHAFGVDFLMEGMKDRNENSFAATVSALASRGVKFEVCEITLKNRNLKKEQFIQEADFTPSGVVRLAKLQVAGHAYIKP